MKNPFLLFGGVIGLLIALSSQSGIVAVAGDHWLMSGLFAAGCLTMWSGFLGHKTTTETLLEESVHVGTGYLLAAHLFFGWLFYLLIPSVKPLPGIYFALWLPSLIFTAMFYLLAAVGALITCWKEFRLQHA